MAGASSGGTVDVEPADDREFIRGAYLGASLGALLVWVGFDVVGVAPNPAVTLTAVAGVALYVGEVVRRG